MVENFFDRNTLIVARDLLGMELVRKTQGGIIRAVITETEAYRGFHDKASHASRGKTKRNAPMFGKPGTIYVYLVYGMHWCLNIVTEREGYPAAVLIRSIRFSDQGKDVSGPGRVTRVLFIDSKFNGKSIEDSKGGLALGVRRETPRRIERHARIGVSYAEEYAHKPWRFLIQ